MTLAEIVIYPIKGCHGLSLERCAITGRGLRHDRAYVLSDRDGNIITEKTHTSIGALTYRVSGSTLFALAPGMPAIDLASTSASLWFGTLLECECKLSATTSENQFEAAPISIVSRQSLAALNRLLARPFDRLRFRPNLIVDAKDEAFSEVTWNALKIGAVFLNGAGACVRPHMLVSDMPWSKARIAGKSATKNAISSPSGHLVFGAYFSVGIEGEVLVDARCHLSKH